MAAELTTCVCCKTFFSFSARFNASDVLVSSPLPVPRPSDHLSQLRLWSWYACHDARVWSVVPVIFILNNYCNRSPMFACAHIFYLSLFSFRYHLVYLSLLLFLYISWFPRKDLNLVSGGSSCDTKTDQTYIIILAVPLVLSAHNTDIFQDHDAVNGWSIFSWRT